MDDSGKEIDITPIGHISVSGKDYSIHIKNEYIPGLTNLEGFSHLQVVWWGHLFDNPHDRKKLTAEKLFKKGPDTLGIFATRSPIRPNPILISTVQITKIDMENGILYTPFIDAEDGTPVLDIKPYLKTERIRDCEVPGWCSHWPEWQEGLADFDFRGEFNF